MPSFVVGNKTRLQKEIDKFKIDYGLTVNIEVAGINGNGEDLAQLEESEIPSCIGFMNLAIDPSNLDIILTPTALITPIRLSNLGTMFSKILERPIDNDELLRLIEIYKLNGKFDQFCKDICDSDVVMGSIVGSYISQTTTLLPKEVRHKLLVGIQSLRSDKNVFVSDLCDYGGPLCRVYRSATLESMKGYVNTTDSDQTLYKLSLVGSSYNYDEKVTDIKCSNILEMTKLARDEDDVIFSSDVKKSLTRMGFDKLITARELTSIANAVNTSAKDKISSSWKVDSARLPYTEYRKSNYDRRLNHNNMVNIGLKNMFDLLVKLAKAFGGD